MKTKQFTPNKWIIFDLEKATAIGRTYCSTEGDQLIAYVTEKGEHKTTLFSEIENPRILHTLGQVKRDAKNSNYRLN